MLAEELAEFGRCIRGEAEPETGAEEGLAALGAVLQALESQAEAVALMRAAEVEASAHRRGRPRSMTLCARDGTALVAVEAVPLNPVEIRVAAGRDSREAEPPYVPGLEGSGTVVESSRVAPGTQIRFGGQRAAGLRRTGDARRASRRPGGFAGGAAGRRRAMTSPPRSAWSASPRCSRWSARRRPPGSGCWSWERRALSDRWQSSWPRSMGASRVVGAGRSAEHLERVRELGADEIVELGADDLSGGLRAGGRWAARHRHRCALGRAHDGGASCDRHGGAPRQRGPVRGQATFAFRSRSCATVRARSMRSRPGLTGLGAGKATAYRRVLEHAVAGRLTVDREVWCRSTTWPPRGNGRMHCRAESW